MKIQIDGCNTLNKGAELMLYAILEQIEKKYPGATVYYNPNNYRQAIPVKSKLKLRERKAIQYDRYVNKVLKKFKLHSTYFTCRYPQRGINWVLDGGGFQFADQWNYSEQQIKDWENYYRKLKQMGTKIVLLPQAFGPFENAKSKRLVAMVNAYADVVIAREEMSFNYIRPGIANKEKVWLYPDFTLAVAGAIPQAYQNLRGKVCIIPNRKMISKGKTSSLEYLNFLGLVIQKLQAFGKEVFLLNHEGKGDLEICAALSKKFEPQLQIVDGLNAKEVKGIIGASSLVISSRFHGVASALNQGIPCLATSWSHKYELLFQDFGLENMIIQVDNSAAELEKKLGFVLNHWNYLAIKKSLYDHKQVLQQRNVEMWHKVWEV